MRSHFDNADENGNGLIEKDELIKFIKFDYNEYFTELNEDNKRCLEPIVSSFADKVIRAIKGPNVDVNDVSINWVEFREYRQLLKKEKEALQENFEMRIVEQRRVLFGNETNESII